MWRWLQGSWQWVGFREWLPAGAGGEWRHMGGVEASEVLPCHGVRPSMQTECPLKGGHSGGDSNGTFRSNEAKPVYLGAGSKARF
jgi:hypothetical protein